MSSDTCPAGLRLIINHECNGPMFLTMPHTLTIQSSGTIIKLALSIACLGVSLVNPVFADSHAATPPASSVLGYESALTGYKALDGGERSAWKESNDIVGQIGGWRSYANEAEQASQAEADEKGVFEGPVEDEPLEPAVVTPIADATARRIDPATVTTDSTEIASKLEKSESTVAERAISRPPTISYQSTTTAYRLYDDNPPGDWRAANDRVREIGGWRTYAKEIDEVDRSNIQADTESGSPQ